MSLSDYTLKAAEETTNDKIGKAGFEMEVPKREWFDLLEAIDKYRGDRTGTNEDHVRLCASKAGVVLL